MSKNSRSRVHPNYKARHRVRNWAEYDQALARRGDLTIWFTPEAISAWQPPAEGLRGGGVMVVGSRNQGPIGRTGATGRFERVLRGHA